MSALDIINAATQAADILRRDGRLMEAAELEQAIGATRYAWQRLRARAQFVRDTRNNQWSRQMAAGLLAEEVARATESQPSREVVAFHAVRPVGGG